MSTVTGVIFGAVHAGHTIFGKVPYPRLLLATVSATGRGGQFGRTETFNALTCVYALTVHRWHSLDGSANMPCDLRLSTPIRVDRYTDITIYSCIHHANTPLTCTLTDMHHMIAGVQQCPSCPAR